MPKKKIERSKKNVRSILGKPKMKVREKKKEQKKNGIMKAAFEIFAKKGFAETTVDEIAERAGVGKGTVYDYFRTKLELLLEVFKTHSVFLEVTDLEELLGSKKEEEVLKHLAEKSFEYARKNLKLRRLWMMEALRTIPNSSGVFYRTIAAPLIEALQAYIAKRQEEGVFRRGDPFILAHTFWGMLFSFRFWYEMMGGKALVPRPTQEIVSEVVRLYLDGLRTQARTPG